MERYTTKDIENGYDEEWYKADEVDARIKELEEVIKDMLDAFWDMSPLQYAGSRGFQCMTDEVGEEIKRRARKLIPTEALKEGEDERVLGI